MTIKVTFNPMEAMLVGFNTVANAVKSTLGPRGRNVYVTDSYQPEITNDGSTIAQKIILKDKVADMGAYIIRNVSGQQNDDVGDGTTTVSVLTQSIVEEAVKRPENPVAIEDSLKRASQDVLKKLAKVSVKVKKEDIERVALISTENKLLAKNITELFNKLGENAIINVEDSMGFDIHYEISEGYQAHVGFLAPQFITDKKKAQAVFTNVPVVVSEKKISTVQDITKIFEDFKKEGITQAVIVCEEIENSILGILVHSKLMGTFNSLVVRATGPLLLDIEAAVGATRISEATGVTFENIDITKHLGRAKKIVSDANSTTFIGTSNKAKAYASLLESQAATEPNMYRSQKLLERVAKLRGGIGTLYVGAPTDTERNYLKRKAEDGVKAVPAALKEGICEGGGMTLWRIGQAIKPKTIGDEILKKSLQSPLRTIIENAGKDYTEIITNMPEGRGYDAKNDRYVEMIAEGIIDPTKVERCAVENSISAASKFITAAATLTDDDFEEKK